MENQVKPIEVIIRKSVFIFVGKAVLIEVLSNIFYTLLLWYMGSDAPLEAIGGFSFFLALEISKFFIFAFLFLNWHSQYYEITDDEIIIFRGIIKKQKKALSMKYAEAVTMDKGLFGRIGNFGTITVSYLANTRFELHLPHIPTPEKYTRLLEHSISKNKEAAHDLVASQS